MIIGKFGHYSYFDSLLAVAMRMQQVRPRQRVRHVGCRGLTGAHELLPAINSDMRLHAEIPLFSLGRLVHLRGHVP